MCRNNHEEDAAVTLYGWCAAGLFLCVSLAVFAHAWKRVEQIRAGHECADMAREKGWVK